MRPPALVALTILMPLAACSGPGDRTQTARPPSPAGSEVGRSAARTLLEHAEGFYSGTSGQMDDAEARRLFLNAAETGDAVANLRVATLRAIGRCGFTQDEAAADRAAKPLLEEVQAIADSGDPYAKYLIGLTHSAGVGRRINAKAANRLFRQAAEAGDVWAMWNLGWAYQSGLGVRADQVAAIDWYEQAAEAGHAWAMTVLGEAHLGVRPGRLKDVFAAKDWFERGIGRGDPAAMTRMGELHQRGEGVAKNARAALEWFLKAAQLGESLAMYHLAHAYFSGQGVPVDYGTAFDWLQTAAEAGFFYAVFEIAETYEHGLMQRGKQIVQPNLSKATQWYRRAAEMGSPAAARWLEERESE